MSCYSPTAYLRGSTSGRAFIGSVFRGGLEPYRQPHFSPPRANESLMHFIVFPHHSVSQLETSAASYPNKRTSGIHQYQLLGITTYLSAMASFGKLTTSGVSMTNENTLALVNLNLDVSLFRCDPSAEFLPVGSAMTTQRKQEAETGQIHKTACRLGFLFHEILPDTPRLIKAYGVRVSEILSSPDINPQGTENDGPFRAFIGADCTSIWAAATSGPASIAVLLLACMLANAWDAKTATSIWVELVQEKRRQIQAKLDDSKVVSPHAFAAAQQDITRSELAMWDASARSWLRRAGLSMTLRHTQFSLIVSNMTIPYPGGGSTFERVTLTWIRAMEVLEKLLNNLPQQACDQAVLLGISSWHLYPDLLVFQTEAKKVSFNDSLFPNSGVLSLGLEYKDRPNDNFLRWSLALSHLKFYGDPVPVRSEERLGRVNISQLWLVALGTIFRQWGISYASFDSTIAWFEELGNRLRHHTGAQCVELTWLLRLCYAASELCGEKRNLAIMLVKYGWRRAQNFLGSESGHLPFFGLCNPSAMSALSRASDVECGIEYLRQIASRMELGANDALISYTGTISGGAYTEWVTIRPIAPQLAERENVDALRDSERKHARWIHMQYDGSDLEAVLEERRRTIELTGELCRISTNKQDLPVEVLGSNGWRYIWRNSPKLFDGQFHAEFVCANEPECRTFNLWVRRAKYWPVQQQSLIDSAVAELATPEQGLEWLRGMSDADKICRYLLASLQVRRRSWG